MQIFFFGFLRKSFGFPSSVLRLSSQALRVCSQTVRHSFEICSTLLRIHAKEVRRNVERIWEELGGALVLKIIVINEDCNWRSEIRLAN